MRSFSVTFLTVVMTACAAPHAVPAPPPRPEPVVEARPPIQVLAAFPAGSLPDGSQVRVDVSAVPTPPTDLAPQWGATWHRANGTRFSVDGAGRVVLESHSRRATVVDPVTGAITQEHVAPPPPPPSQAMVIHGDGRQETIAVDQFSIASREHGYSVSYRGIPIPTVTDRSFAMPIAFADHGEGVLAGRSPDGRHGYVLTAVRSVAGDDHHFRPDLDEVCLDRITVTPPRLDHLRCFVAEGYVILALSPGADRAALVIPRSEAFGLSDLLWIDLADGAVVRQWRGRWTLPAAWWGGARLDERGRLAMLADDGVMIFDLATGHASQLALGGPAAADLQRPIQLPDGRLVLLRARDEVPELIAVDVDALLPTAVDVPVPVIGGADPDRPTASAVERFWEAAPACPGARTLRRSPHRLGVEYACVDRAGRRDGRYAIVGDDGPVMSGSYRRDQRAGVWLAWDGFGAAISSATFVDDHLSGEHRRWHPGGALRERSRWRRSRRIWLEARYAGGAIAHTLDWVGGERRETWTKPDGTPWPCYPGDYARPDACP